MDDPRSRKRLGVSQNNEVVLVVGRFIQDGAGFAVLVSYKSKNSAFLVIQRLEFRQDEVLRVPKVVTGPRKVRDSGRQFRRNRALFRQRWMDWEVDVWRRVGRRHGPGGEKKLHVVDGHGA